MYIEFSSNAKSAHSCEFKVPCLHFSVYSDKNMCGSRFFFRGGGCFEEYIFLLEAKTHSVISAIQYSLVTVSNVKHLKWAE